jgi:DNA-binding PadR family transcriptional regulator
MGASEVQPPRRVSFGRRLIDFARSRRLRDQLLVVLRDWGEGYGYAVELTDYVEAKGFRRSRVKSRLKALERAGLVESRVYYRLTDAGYTAAAGVSALRTER